MATLSRSAAAGSDDASELKSDGTVTLDNGNYTLLQDHSSSDAQRYYGGFRFSTGGSGSWPSNGDTIDTGSVIKLTASDTFRDTISHAIKAQLTDSPAAFTTTTSDISSRTLTSASVSWDANDLGASQVSSPELNTMLQEWIDAQTPTALVLVFTPLGLSTPEPFRALNYENGSGYADLVINYTAGGGLSIPIAAYHYNHHLGSMSS